MLLSQNTHSSITPTTKPPPSSQYQSVPPNPFPSQQPAQDEDPSLLVIALIIAPVARLMHPLAVELCHFRISCTVHQHGFRLAAIGIGFVELADHVGRHANELCSDIVSSGHSQLTRRQKREDGDLPGSYCRRRPCGWSLGRVCTYRT